jgi:unsaturated pyranuronate lyase
MSFLDLRSAGEIELAPGIKAKIVTTDSMTVSHVNLAAGSILPSHTHPNEQVVNVISGELELVVGETTHLLVPGTVLVLAPDVAHEGRAITDVEVIDVFCPAREDMRKAYEAI